MAQSQSSLAGDSNLKGGHLSHGTAYASVATRDGERFKLSGSELTTNVLNVKVSTPFTADDQVNPIEALTMILKAALMMDPNAHIMSNDPTCSPIDKISDIAKISNIDKYAVDLQTNAIKKQFVYFVTLETTVSFHNLKFNKELYAWLKENKHFLVQNTMKTNYTAAIGYFMGMHPTLSSRDAMKGTLDGYIPSDIDYNLITVSTFYIDQKGKKVNTHVVEIHVDAKEAARTKELLSDAWSKEDFVKELEDRSVGMPIAFIPNIQKGVMEVPVFRETLRRQTEFARNTIAISVEGIGGLEVEVNRQGSLVSLADIVKNLKGDSGQPLISGIEPTKLTHSSGRYLFLTQKDVVNEAEKKLDKLFEKLAHEGQLNALAMEGMFIRRINQIQSKPVAAYAESLRARFSPPVATVQAPAPPSTPTRNAWNRTPTFKLNHANFPELNDTPTRRHKDKKARMETSTLAEDDNSLSPPSVGTTQTELTDERTEIQSTLANMQDTFAKQIKSIKDANEAKVRHAEERIQQAEQTYIAAQQAILHEFNTLTQNYSNVRESFANLSSDVRKAQVVQDKRHLGMKQTIGTMMQILVGVHQNLANGTNPQPLTQEQVDQIMQNAYEENERDGAPGTNVITESSSTTQQESGRKS